MLFAIAGILQAVVRMLTYIGIEKTGAAVFRKNYLSPWSIPCYRTFAAQN
jgi:hypothetical protein